jgi:hypothetical protein
MKSSARVVVIAMASSVVRCYIFWDVARFGDWAGKSYIEQATRYFYENRSKKFFPYQEFLAPAA